MCSVLSWLRFNILIYISLLLFVSNIAFMEMMKRKDGSYSRRGLWDNIRKAAGSGKKPTKAMLKQEAKIKKDAAKKSKK